MTREEAINLVKQVLPCLNIDEKIREGFVTLIPELKESEDERIRKNLIELLLDTPAQDIISHNLELSKVLAYLEKQKEQKPAEWSEEDGAKLGALINYFDGDALDYSTDDIVNWLKSLRPQSKQKQNDYITPHKEFFKFIYDRLINVHKENPNVDYMRSFKERLNNLSFGEKQEWSEEDEEMLNSCISSIEESKENRYAYKETDGDTSYDREIDWLKSLRNRVGKEFLQPHWKPSEEQMEALKDAFRKDGCNEYRKVINSLYCDLQKLL